MLAGGDLEDQADTVAEGVAELFDRDQLGLIGDDREFGKNRTLSFASSCNQFIVFQWMKENGESYLTNKSGSYNLPTK